MKIIIIGNGKVGYTLAEQLSLANHDLIVVDQHGTALQRADSNLDVMCVAGNGASIRTLMEAGAGQADLVIAVTNYDEVNIVCCLLAKKLGAGHTIARIRAQLLESDVKSAVEALRQSGLSKSEALALVERFWDQPSGKEQV